MKELLDYILVSLIGKDNYTVEEKEDGEVMTFIIHPESEFMGRIIGKGGATIKAISDVVRIKAKLENKTVYVNVAES